MRGASEYRNGDASDVSGIKALSDHQIQIELLDPLPIYPALLTNLRSAIAVKPESNESDVAVFSVQDNSESNHSRMNQSCLAEIRIIGKKVRRF